METEASEQSVTDQPSGPTVMVAVSNPRTESALVGLAGAIAQHEGGRVLVIHVVTVPDQTALEEAAANRARIDQSSDELLSAAVADAAAFDAPVETKTILSHRGIGEVFDAARTNDADAVVMGYRGARLAGGRVEGSLDELAHDLPCDFLVFDGQELAVSNVLVPTAGGPSSDLSADVARALRDVFDASVSLLYVADGGGDDHADGDAHVDSDANADDDTEDDSAGHEFLAEWAEGHGLADATLRVETGEFEQVLSRIGAEYDLVIVGATEQGLLSRVVRGSLASDAISALDTPVVLAERPTDRSLWERLVGGR